MAVPSPPERIAGLSSLKGLVLYGAVVAFAGLYVDFIVEIAGAEPGKPPVFDSAKVSAAAALAGVLGSAFAVYVGVPTKENATNQQLKEALDDARTTTVWPKLKRSHAWVRRLLSLEAADTKSPSWPLTFGIWVYAVVGSAVAITYVLNQSETPEQIKTPAIAFAGYVIALVYTAYGVRPQSA